MTEDRIAQTADCLYEFLDNEEHFYSFYSSYYMGGFFSGISQYIKPKTSRVGSAQADELVGYEITLSKMKRMKDKMQDKKNSLSKNNGKASKYKEIEVFN